jgi:hypothetical protein
MIYSCIGFANGGDIARHLSADCRTQGETKDYSLQIKKSTVSRLYIWIHKVDIHQLYISIILEPMQRRARDEFCNELGSQLPFTPCVSARAQSQEGLPRFDSNSSLTQIAARPTLQRDSAANTTFYTYSRFYAASKAAGGKTYSPLRKV